MSRNSACSRSAVVIRRASLASALTLAKPAGLPQRGSICRVDLSRVDEDGREERAGLLDAGGRLRGACLTDAGLLTVVDRERSAEARLADSLGPD